MQKILTTLFFVLFSTIVTVAQPGELSTPMSFQYLLDNPAAAGIDGRHHIMLGAYQKWFNLDDAPQTFYLSTSHTFISRSFGIGLTLVQDKAALIKNTRANLNLALHLNPNSDHRFSIGATARYQRTGFGIPNVVDPFLADSPTTSGINLGLGLNYQYRNDDDMLLNIQLQSPVFPASQEITKANTDFVLAYSQQQALVFQANLRYPTGGGNFLTPSLRFQGELGDEGGFKKSQIVDIGLGLSFLEDVLSVRLGYRSSQASMVYGGVGFSFGNGSQAHLLYEPTGPFGASAAAGIDLAFGEYKPDSNAIIRKKSIQLCYKDSICLNERWANFNRNKAFNFSTTTPAGSHYTELNIAFGDDNNSYLDLFKQESFIAGTPLDQLATAIQQLYNEELLPNGHKIIQVTLRALVRNDLDSDSYEDFTGSSIQLDYWQDGSQPIEKRISDGASLTEAQLAAFKIHFLANQLQRRIPAIYTSTIRKEVNLDQSVLSSRQIQIILVIQ